MSLAQARDLVDACSAGTERVRTEYARRRSVTATGENRSMQSLGMRRYTFSIGAAAALVAGCGGSQTGTPPSQGFCPLMVPWVQLLYPIPGTKAVSPSVGQMVFAATGVTRIQLGAGKYPYEETVATKREPLPNPLPTPIATPGPYGQFLTTQFAVSFKRLKSRTRYEARGWVVFNGSSCNAGSLPVPPGWATIGSFSTE